MGRNPPAQVISLYNLAQAAHPSGDGAVLEGFVKGLSKERESFYWEILGGSPMKVTIIYE